MDHILYNLLDSFQISSLFAINKSIHKDYCYYYYYITSFKWQLSIVCFLTTVLVDWLIDWFINIFYLITLFFVTTSCYLLYIKLYKQTNKQKQTN